MSSTVPAPGGRVKWAFTLTGLLLGVLFLWHGAALWGGVVFCGGDLVNNEIPRRVFWQREGLWTLWFPHTFSGWPYLADIQAGALYPPKWLLLLPAPVWRMTTFLILAHMAAGGLGFYAFSRLRLGRSAAVLAAMLWLCGGYLLLRLGQGIVIFLYGLAWFPWLWLAAERCGPGGRRWTAALGLLGGMQILAGAPQLVQITGFGLAIWALGRILSLPDWRPRLRLLRHYVVAALIALAIAAPQLVASSQFLTLGAGRGESAEYETLAKDSLEPRSLLSQLAPEFFTPGNAEDTYWGSRAGYHEVNAYLGVGALLLAALAVTLWRRAPGLDRRWRTCFLILAALGLLFALGRTTPVYWLAFEWIPTFDLFRVPSRWILWTIGPLILLAASGFEALLTAPDKAAPEEDSEATFERAVLLRWLTLGGTLLAVFVVLRLARDAVMDAAHFRQTVASQVPHLTEITTEAAGSALIWGAAMTVLTLLAGVLLVTRRLSPPVARALFFAVVLVDLYRFWMPWRQPIPTDIPGPELPSEAPFHRITAAEFEDYFYPETDLVQFLQEQDGRVLATDELFGFQFDQFTRELYGERPAVFGLEMMRGYQPLLLASYTEDMAKLSGLEQFGAFLIAPVVQDRSVLDAYNGHIVLGYSNPGYEELGLEPVLTTPFGLTAWRNPHAPGWAWASSDASWPGLEGRDRSVAVEILVREPDRQLYRVRIENGTKAHLHLAETEYPGWRISATQGGDVPVVTGKGRSIALEQGDWTVTRWLQPPPAMRWTLPLAALVFIAALAASLIPSRRPVEPPLAT